MEYRGAMSTETCLVADAATVDVRQRGSAIAGIWLVTRDSAFPEAGWTDFVVVLLVWWADALLKLLRNDGQQARVHFMDGPPAVDVSTSSGILQFRMIDRDRQVGAPEAAVRPFVVDLVSQSRSVLDACRSKGWWSTDADALELLLEELDLEIRRI